MEVHFFFFGSRLNYLRIATPSPNSFPRSRAVQPLTLFLVPTSILILSPQQPMSYLGSEDIIILEQKGSGSPDVPCQHGVLWKPHSCASFSFSLPFHEVLHCGPCLSWDKCEHPEKSQYFKNHSLSSKSIMLHSWIL